MVNKADLADSKKLAVLKQALNNELNEEYIIISAKKQDDISRLKLLLGKLTETNRLHESDSIVSNIRHYEALSRSSESLARVIEGIAGKIPQDLVAMDLRQGIYYLGEIIGEISADDILGNIFKNFCIGK